MHYNVEIGPVKNSTAGVYTDMCFSTLGVAQHAGTATLNNIERGRNRIGTFKVTRITDTNVVTMCFDGQPTWRARVRECDSADCYVRVRLPRVLQRVLVDATQ